MEHWKARVTLLLWQRGTFSSEVLCQAAQWAIFSLPSLVCDWAQTHQQLNKRLKNGRVCCVHVWGNRNSKIIVPCNINHAPGLGGSSRGSLGSCSTADRYHRFRASSPSSGLFQTHLQLQPWAGASAEPSLRLRARAALTHMTERKSLEQHESIKHICLMTVCFYTVSTISPSGLLFLLQDWIILIQWALHQYAATFWRWAPRAWQTLSAGWYSNFLHRHFNSNESNSLIKALNQPVALILETLEWSGDKQWIFRTSNLD